MILAFVLGVCCVILSAKLLFQWLAAGLSLTSIASLLTIVATGHGGFLLPVSDTEQPDKPISSYDVLDAIAACRDHSKEKFDNTLLRSYVDDHSTRFEEDRGVYLVVLTAHIGSKRKYDDATVYCYVRPATNKVTYFRSYDSDKKSLQSGMGFDAFKDIFKRKG